MFEHELLSGSEAILRDEIHHDLATAASHLLVLDASRVAESNIVRVAIANATACVE